MVRLMLGGMGNSILVFDMTVTSPYTSICILLSCVIKSHRLYMYI